MSGYKAVLFDCFDVLFPDHCREWLAAHGLDRKGAYAELSRQLDLGTLSYEGFVAELAQLSGQTPAEVMQEFSQFAQPDVAVIDFLRSLRSTYKTALVSNAHADEVRPLLQTHTLEHLFDAIVISAEVGLRKPDPKIFEHALAQLGCTPAEAIFIDDNEDNVVPATELGITGIVFKNYQQLMDHIQPLLLPIK